MWVERCQSNGARDSGVLPVDLVGRLKGVGLQYWSSGLSEERKRRASRSASMGRWEFTLSRKRATRGCGAGVSTRGYVTPNPKSEGTKATGLGRECPRIVFQRMLKGFAL